MEIDIRDSLKSVKFLLWIAQSGKDKDYYRKAIKLLYRVWIGPEKVELN